MAELVETFDGLKDGNACDRLISLVPVEAREVLSAEP